MTKEQFIAEIAKYVQKYAPEFNIKVCSPIIAQACLESGYGTSKKASFHNYFGLKYRANRVTCNKGYFVDGGSEQNKDGTYTNLPSSTAWYAFENLEKGVLGYFQFINIANYSNLKGVTDPLTYLQNIKTDGYATSLNYVDNVYKVIQQWNLTKYDTITTKEKEKNNMGYTNSSLVDCVRMSPNHSGQRNHKIDRITPHCTDGHGTAEGIGNIFLPVARQASCNYAIGKDGRVCLVVDEANRSWCSSSSSNDHRAITIEVSSQKGAPHTITNESYEKLILLCIDICKRNGIKKLLWLETKEKSLSYNPKDGEAILTAHRWFAAKSCPGDWLYSREGELANRVTAALGGNTSTPSVNSTPAPTPAEKPKTVSENQVPYQVKVTDSSLNIRKGPGTQHAITGVIKDKGVYTIVEEKNGWGKLKSGAGWISLKYTKKR